MKYLSVCSGIEAATVAWHGLGWTPLAFSEIEAFPRAVLTHRYPGVPLHGDFTALREQDWIVDADLLVGGTPCQAFSVAGLRQSLSDDRGNLTLEFVRLADAIDNARGGAGRPPCTIVWENVPGVLSTRDNAFGCYLGALAGEDCPLLPAGSRWPDAGMVVGPARTIAWRVLDAQYFGLAQRRRRVFVVASADPGFDPAEVLFEREGVRRDSAPHQNQDEGLAWDGKHTTQTLDAVLNKGQMLPEKNRFPVVTTGCESCSHPNATKTETARFAELIMPSVPVLDLLKKMNLSTAKTTTALGTPVGLRRLMPIECERLQGFPDGYTAIPWRNKPAEDCPDGPRYKALGNSMAVPVMRWIGERIRMQDNG